MSVGDYSKQLARRQRIGSTTLVVGVDIGCASNAVGFMSKEGKVLGSHLSPGRAGGLNETVNRSKRIENREPPEGSIYSNILN